MSKPDIKALFEAGAHFGHQTSRWNPKMAKYIHSKRGDNHIIDLAQTVEGIENAQKEIAKVAQNERQVLWVGTKKSLREIVRKAADELDQPFVVERWLGGMLTNYTTIGTQIKKLKQLEKRMATGELNNRYNKLEIQRFQEEIDANNKIYGGIKNMKGRAGAVVVTDIIADKNAVAEAKKLGIPVIAIVDTNGNPDGIDFVIPANDDALKSVELILSYLMDAYKESGAKIKMEDK